MPDDEFLRGMYGSGHTGHYDLVGCAASYKAPRSFLPMSKAE